MLSWKKFSFHIFILTGLAGAPLYQVLGGEPQFFLAHQSETIDFIIFIGAISLIVPFFAALSGGTIFSALGRFRPAIIFLIPALLGTLILLPAMKHLFGGNPTGAWMGAIFAAMGFSIIYARWDWAKTFLTSLSVTLPAFPVIFLLIPSILVLFIPKEDSIPYPNISIPSATPVVLVLFDEFPLSSLLNENLQIEKTLYPNFARVAEQAHWFRNASTSYASTRHAIGSILTGIKRGDQQVETYRNFPNNLFTLFGNSYQVVGQESVLRLCPPHICADLNRTSWENRLTLFFKDVWAVFLNVILPEPKKFGAPDVFNKFKNFWSQENSGSRFEEESGPWVKREFNIPMFEPDFKMKMGNSRIDAFHSFLSQVNGEHKKTFYFLHILLPHMPYRYLPSGKTYDRKGLLDNLGLKGKISLGGVWAKDKTFAENQYQRFLAQVGLTDRLLGRLLDRLEQAELLDPALLIVMADHGANFLPGDVRRGISKSSLGGIASIPLFIKLPVQKTGTIDDAPVQTIDILPTIADTFNFQVPWKLDGRSVFGSKEGRPKRLIHDYDLKVSPVPDSLLPALRKSVERKRKLFGAFTSWDDLRIKDDAYQSFMEQPVERFKVVSVPEAGVKFDRLFAEKENDENFVPALVSGTIQGLKGKRFENALVAVNGVFQSQAPIIEGDPLRFLALAPEKNFNREKNKIEVFLVQKRAGGEFLVYKPKTMP